MLSSIDLLRLPYTPDLSEGGIAYACRSLAYTYDRMGGSPVDRMRRIAGGVAVELAFRRSLGEQGVPFDVLGATPFTDPDRYDVMLGGHRCDLKSFLITRRSQISQVRKDPSLLLGAPALVPLDQFAAEGHSARDIYLFAFFLALTTPSTEDMKQALAAGQPAHLVHPLPEGWARPRQWLALGKLALKSECDRPISIEIGGQDAERNFITAALELPPRKAIPAPGEFYSVAYIHAKALPPARIGIHSPLQGEAHIVLPHEWGNIWVYGMDIWLAGWLAHEDFRRKAKVLPAGSRTFQYSQTRTRNLAVPVGELQPLAPLFDRVVEWEKRKAE
ncbi:MAG: hypothetical protein FJZ96_11860 [Chloroflexi bacterium]|nr:hypothetical protein [Chloroflexota bacterium]